MLCSHLPSALQSTGPGASSGPAGDHSELIVRIASLEVENQSLRGGEALVLTAGGWGGSQAGGLGGPGTSVPSALAVVQDLQQAMSKLEARLSVLEKSSPAHRATAPQTQVRGPQTQVCVLQAHSRVLGLSFPSPSAARVPHAPSGAPDQEGGHRHGG